MGQRVATDLERVITINSTVLYRRGPDAIVATVTRDADAKSEFVLEKWEEPSPGARWQARPDQGYIRLPLVVVERLADYLKALQDECNDL